MRAALLLTLSLGGCAAGAAGVAPADLTPLPDQSLTANGRLVLACVDQAVRSGSVSAVRDEDAGLIRFACDGPPAEALFQALGPRSRRIGSEWREGAAVVRASERVVEDLYGVDLCRADGPRHACQVHLNVGDFMFGDAP